MKKDREYIERLYHVILRDIVSIFLDTKESLIVHDTYKAINTSRYCIEEALKVYKVDYDPALSVLINDLSLIILKLIKNNPKISSDKTYLDKTKEFVKNCFLETTQLNDFVIFPNGDMVICNDNMSHDMCIACYIMGEPSQNYLKYLLPDNFDTDNPIVLDREDTDKANILRFHVSPMKDGFIFANRLTTNPSNYQKIKLRKNYLFLEAIGEVL